MKSYGRNYKRNTMHIKKIMKRKTINKRKN